MASSISMRTDARESISKGNILYCFTYNYEMLSHNGVQHTLEGRCTCKYFEMVTYLTVSITFMICYFTMASRIPLRTGALVSISKGIILDCFTYGL